MGRFVPDQLEAIRKQEVINPAFALLLKYCDEVNDECLAPLQRASRAAVSRHRSAPDSIVARARATSEPGTNQLRARLHSRRQGLDTSPTLGRTVRSEGDPNATSEE